MITAPNQRTITINREKIVKGGNKRYTLVYCDNMNQASRTLNGSGFKLYMYFLSNADQYLSGFSPKAVKDAMGLSENTARDAWKELEDKKYIIKDKGNKYYFYETPVLNGIRSVQVKKEFIDEDTDQIYHWTYDELLAAVQNPTLARELWETAKEENENVKELNF